MKMFNTKHGNTKNGNTKNGGEVKMDIDLLLKDQEKLVAESEELQKELHGAMTIGDQAKVEKVLLRIESNKKAIEDILSKLPEEFKAKAEQEIASAKKHVDNQASKERDLAGQKSTTKMTPEEMREASKNLDKQLPNQDEDKKTDTSKENNVITDEKVNKEEVKDQAKANLIAEDGKTEQEVKDSDKDKVVDEAAEKITNIINYDKENKNKDNKDPEDPKAKVTTTDDKEDNSTGKGKKELVPKGWQRVSDDNKSLINVITFMGVKIDYEVGLKHQYRFPNLSVSDGLKRIITAKFPKDNMKPVIEEITFRDYTVHIEKYGNSAVCKLYDPDEICMLEFVSLATVIDVLQDELNDENDCWLSWGTIDQIIKKKRGLKSRIKELNDEDLPSRSRKGKEVAADSETPAPAPEEEKKETLV
jgi:hypothetical protein